MLRGRSRGNAKKSTREEMMAAIYGINKHGDVVHISAYVKGSDVRLAGPHGSEPVHFSNRADIDGWKREAALKWGLTNVIDIPRVLFQSDTEKTKVEKLRVQAKEMKAKLEGSNQP
jgi:hypothetical protein